MARETSGQVVSLLDAHRTLLDYSLRDRLLEAPVQATGEDLKRYLIATLADCRTERLRVLFLDSGNRLLADELIAEGDAARVWVTPRMILNRALDVQAVGLILVHNHPGGRPEPSEEDLAFTRRVAEAGRHLTITLHDHLIVAGDACVSLRARGALP